jgi:glucose-6-phosphate 1-dehydrogenase
MSDCTIVIFGATGDLTKRKLIPSLFRLYQSGLLPQQFAIVGISNIAFEVLAFRNQMIESIKVAFDGEKLDQNQLSQFAERIFYMKGSFENPDTFISLKRELEITETENNLSGNRVYYLAVPPHFFSPIVIQLGKSGLAEESEKQWRRLVIEKPLGHDLNSVRQLAKNIKQSFEEHQIYRIDHYLGKETVQNIIIFRFANGIFEPTWNRRYIDSVQITVAEELGVEHRGSSYDNVGALRDMIPSHLFQVLALVAMEPPASVEAEAVRDEYKKVLNSVVPMKQEDVLMHTVRAQYLNGEIDGEPVVTYRNELDVDKLSDTETYAALRLTIDNWRWSGVPFYLRTGKRLKKRVTEVVIQFKAAPVRLFCNW